MSQIFHPSTNTLSRVSIFGALFVVAGALWITLQVTRSPYVTLATVARDQPVPFSHAHHVGAIGIDCRYCHTSAESSRFAGIPPTATCINCHSQLYSDSPTLEPVRESFRTGRPIVWTRVNDLPDFAHFDHSVHINKGVGCVTCHGRVDTMALVWQEESLAMEWCLQCHRDPAPHLQPKDTVTRADWVRPDDADRLGTELMKAYQVRTRTDCSACHR